MANSQDIILLIIVICLVLSLMGWWSYTILSGKVDPFIRFINKTAYDNEDVRINRKRMRIVITAVFWIYFVLFLIVKSLDPPETITDGLIRMVVLIGALVLIYFIARILGKTWCLKND